MQEPTQQSNGISQVLTLSEMWEVYRLWNADHTPESLRMLLVILNGEDVEDISPAEIASNIFLGLYKNGLESFRDFIKSMVV